MIIFMDRLRQWDSGLIGCRHNLISLSCSQDNFVASICKNTCPLLRTFEFTWFSCLRLACSCISMLHIHHSFKFHFWSRGSIVGLLTILLNWAVRGSNPGSAAHLDIYSMCAGALSGGKGLRRPARDVDHLPQTSAKVTNEWSYTSSPPCVS